MISVYQDSLAPSVYDTISVNGSPFDLTSATVDFNARFSNGSVVAITGAAVIVDAVDGTVRYDWNSGDTADLGLYRAWWTVTPSGGAAQDSPEFDLEIIAHAPDASTDLCTLTDVRNAMQLDSRITNLDDVLSSYITMASNRLQVEYGKFLPAESGVTYRFRVGQKGRARFYNNGQRFCRNITGVVLNPESFNQTLDGSIPDYIGEPYETMDGVYTSIRISSFIPIQISPIALRFGYNALVDVTGDWGYETVPDAVRLATMITVRSWVRRDMTQFANQPSYDGELIPQPAGTYNIPQAARDHLGLYSTIAGIY